MHAKKLLIIILALVISVIGIIACNSTVVTPQTPLFALIPHEPGAAPMIPHPEQGFIDCDLCHIEAAGISFIKIDKEHSCEECHESSEYQGVCEEATPIIATCAIDICHLYP